MIHTLWGWYPIIYQWDHIFRKVQHSWKLLIVAGKEPTPILLVQSVSEPTTIWLTLGESLDRSQSLFSPLSGKGTDMATMLRLEKYGRIKLLLWKRAPADPNAPKWMRAYAKDSGTVDGTDFHSFFRSWQLVFWRLSSRLKNLTKNVQSKTTRIDRYVSIWSIFCQRSKIDV